MKSGKPTGWIGPHVLVLLGYNEHDFMRGILSYAREARWTLDTNYNRIGLTPPSDERFDGIITVVGKRQELDVLRRFPRVPCVDLSGAWLWDLPARGADKVGRVTYDPAALGRLAAGHLLDQGLRRIAFINTCNGWHERPAARTAAAETRSRGAIFHEIPLYREVLGRPPYSITRHRPAALRWLERALDELPKPAGVIVMDDWAPHLLRACWRAGIAVPADLAVMGMYNHLDACGYSAVPISSVDADFERIAREGAKLLGRLMKGHPVPSQPILLAPRGIVVRQSTDIVAVKHRQVARAVQFIRDHFRDHLPVTMVANEAGLSHRGLAAAFQRELGESVANYIVRYRAEHAGRLLAQTAMKAADIASHCGFSSMEHLSRAFKRIMGVPPSVYRQQHRHQAGFAAANR